MRHASGCFRCCVKSDLIRDRIRDASCVMRQDASLNVSTEHPDARRITHDDHFIDPISLDKELSTIKETIGDCPSRLDPARRTTCCVLRI